MTFPGFPLVAQQVRLRFPMPFLMALLMAFLMLLGTSFLAATVCFLIRGTVPGAMVQAQDMDTGPGTKAWPLPGGE